MSFDVFAQRFVGGEPAEAENGVLSELLAPHLMRVESESDFAELHFDDGTADFYGVAEPGTGFMVNHVSGQLAWELFVRMASAGDMALMAPGVPTMIFSEEVRQHLPEGLAEDAVVLSSGADILRTFANA
ncbi:hypothetical protein [Cellulomonas carbonis]|uniref:Uncharacterized protein n=1 Tax=Cellulomonas carbonis T26 TaxID=947969 RepID=A0A0A0BXR1_9CELL|nr:hypothetical protein [Cellulomonas carbonis]KGM12691.1 hypothetical protein N868_07055 [Cellulomonas carbonis T26]GGC06028.1 hypothetical protein GCM10010972_19040 [Cellulomonas carbonis]